MFRFPPSEIDRLTAAELLRWHSAAVRIHRQTGGRR